MREKHFWRTGSMLSVTNPLTHYSWEAEELKRIAEGKDLLFGVTLYTACTRDRVFMREMITQGKIRKIRLVNAST